MKQLLGPPSLNGHDTPARNDTRAGFAQTLKRSTTFVARLGCLDELKHQAFPTRS